MDMTGCIAAGYCTEWNTRKPAEAYYTFANYPDLFASFLVRNRNYTYIASEFERMYSQRNSPCGKETSPRDRRAAPVRKRYGPFFVLSSGYPGHRFHEPSPGETPDRTFTTGLLEDLDLLRSLVTSFYIWTGAAGIFRLQNDQNKGYHSNISDL